MKKHFFKGLLLVIIFPLLFPLGSRKVLAQETVDYVWYEPPIVEITPEKESLREELEKLVREIIQTGQLAPTVFDNAYVGKVMFWATPTELVSSLSMAYPYLSTSLQGELKSYFQSQLEYFFNLDSPFRSLAWGEGSKREAFPVDRSVWFPTLHPGDEICYAFWQYAYYTGGWDFINSHWGEIKDFCPVSKKDSYPAIAGLIGLAKMAQHRGEDSLANNAAGKAAESLTSGNFSQFVSLSDSRLQIERYNLNVFLWGEDNHGPSVYAGLFSREIGQYLKDQEKSAVEAYLVDKEAMWPLWYLTLISSRWGRPYRDDCATDEVNYTLPEVSWTLFMLHAYILKDDQETLKAYLDFPWRKGDLFQIQKLVATIEASSSGEPPTPAPSDVNQDGSVNTQDALAIFSAWLTDGSPGFNYREDVNGDSKVNGIDLGWVVKDFTF